MKNLIKFSVFAVAASLFAVETQAQQWDVNSTTGDAYNTNSNFIGINTQAPVDLLTIEGGDLRIIETSDYSKMPDGNAADIILEDKVGGSLDIFQLDNIGHIDISGTSTELTIGNSWLRTNTCTFYPDGTLCVGALDDGHPGTPLRRSSGYRLFVADGIMTEKVKIALKTDNTNWPDYVFENDYKLKPLSEVEDYINENKHLPEVPSSEEVYKEGLNVAEMDARLLKKIEEITLYVIELEKKNQELEDHMIQLEKKNKKLIKRMNVLEEK